jgi:steroid 5-alpha reductase family enzyme
VVESYWILLLLGWGAAAALQLGLYGLQRATGDATTVDAGWAASLVLVAIVYAVLAPGEVEHRVLIATLAAVENLRIAYLVLRRVGKGEDPRYQELRRRWREHGREQLTFFVFFQGQALIAVVFSLPLLLAAFNRESGLEPLEWAGAALWLLAASLELAADRQLGRFKSDPANKGKTMREGLWRYSRHPNYFFQWLTWCAYALIALAAPWGWIGLAAPALMLYLILFVTGIPPSEEQALKSRGDDFRRYQRETSAFVPWFPRRAAS